MCLSAQSNSWLHRGLHADQSLIGTTFCLPLNRVSVWGLQSEKPHLGELGGPSLGEVSGVTVNLYPLIVLFTWVSTHSPVL